MIPVRFWELTLILAYLSPILEREGLLGWWLIINSLRKVLDGIVYLIRTARAVDSYRNNLLRSPVVLNIARITYTRLP